MTPPPPPATAVAGELPLQGRARPITREAAKNVPVKVWASVGGVIFLFEAYVIIRWVTGPYFTPVRVGVSQIPGWMKISLATQEILFGLILAGVLWHFVVRPFRRDGRFSSDGLLSIAIFVFAWFQDPIANYSGAVFTYNSGLLNMGSWINDVPGALTQGQPGAQISESIWVAMIYPGLLFLFAALGTWFMRKLKQRRPQTTTLGLIASGYAFMIFADFVLEGVIMMPLGGYTYAGAPKWSSINPGHYYKYTILEGLFFGASCTAWAALRYFKDDQGHTVVERGIDTLAMSENRKAIVRFLAIGAFVSLTMFAFTTVPWNWESAHQSAWPKDVQRRTYFTQGLCGAATTYACAGPSVPLPRSNGSAHIAPDGRLVVPAGVHLPARVPLDH